MAIEPDFRKGTFVDASAKRIVNFINDALHEAHDSVKNEFPDFHDFKRVIKKAVTGVDVSTDSDGRRSVSIGVINGGPKVIEVVEPAIVTPELRRQFRSLILELVHHHRGR